RLDLLFIGNTTGQILFLGLATFWVVRLHIPKKRRNEGGAVRAYLRFSLPDESFVWVGWAALLFVVVQPVVWMLGYLNGLIPAPESLVDMQNSQAEMIEQYLRTDGVLWFGLLHIALVPSICEEILFRGYVQGSLERSWGVMPAIWISGLLFGLFHLQLTNLLPLAGLGVLLAVLTWKSGSLLPAITAHLVNNGGAVLMAVIAPDLAFAEMAADQPPPYGIFFISLLLTGSILYYLLIQRRENHGTI
ncbi:MAG: CPBP family glutamic-type intramembrane protease, partial [Bacteroidota bacterium]